MHLTCYFANSILSKIYYIVFRDWGFPILVFDIYRKVLLIHIEFCGGTNYPTSCASPQNIAKNTDSSSGHHSPPNTINSITCVCCFAGSAFTTRWIYSISMKGFLRVIFRESGISFIFSTCFLAPTIFWFIFFMRFLMCMNAMEFCSNVLLVSLDRSLSIHFFTRLSSPRLWRDTDIEDWCCGGNSLIELFSLFAFLRRFTSPHPTTFLNLTGPSRVLDNHPFQIKLIHLKLVNILKRDSYIFNFMSYPFWMKHIWFFYN